MGTRKEYLMSFYEELGDETKVCLAVRMPDGSTELIINEHAKTKLAYINKAYDDDLHLIANPLIKIATFMFY